MTTLRLNEVIRKIRGRLARDECAAATDAVLLARFRAYRDDEAFAELVRRHGAMVLGVCRRVLHNAHDAEDAFQATFLVLVRKGSAVRQLGSVGSWLYGVARRTALEARRAGARRRVKEAGAMHGSAVAADSGDELREVLEAEIERLPEKYRAPLVLCDLEGKTRKEAARHLGWPEGTVASRLAGARKTLSGRLARRGLTVPGGVVALSVGGEAATAAVPAALVGSTVRLAVGRAVVSPGLAALVKGVLTAMLLKKLKSGVVVVLAAAILGAGGSVFRGVAGSEARAAEESKARSPMDALRHENELLKLNLHVLLEKVHAQEAELHAMKGRANTLEFRTRAGTPGDVLTGTLSDATTFQFKTAAPGPAGHGEFEFHTLQPGTAPAPVGRGLRINLQPSTVVGTSPAAATVQGVFVLADPLQRAEAAARAMREARDDKARQRAFQELEAALSEVKSHHGNKAGASKAP